MKFLKENKMKNYFEDKIKDLKIQKEKLQWEIKETLADHIWEVLTKEEFKHLLPNISHITFHLINSRLFIYLDITNKPYIISTDVEMLKNELDKVFSNFSQEILKFAFEDFTKIIIMPDGELICE